MTPACDLALQHNPPLRRTITVDLAQATEEAESRGVDGRWGAASTPGGV